MNINNDSEFQIPKKHNSFHMHPFNNHNNISETSCTISYSFFPQQNQLICQHNFLSII